MFCLYYDAATRQVSALNGSGRSGAKSSLKAVRDAVGLPDGQKGDLPPKSAYAVTVPGAAAGWSDTIQRFGSGKLSLAQILAPAIELGEKGFPVSELTAYSVRASWLLLQARHIGINADGHTILVAKIRGSPSRGFSQLC